MLRKAETQDIERMEAVYKERVLFNDAHDIHQWNLSDVSWESLSKTYSIDDFYVLEEEGEIVACACFVDYDPLYWPDLKKGESYFLHKICVHPRHSKKGYSGQLIEFFKSRGKELGYPDVRLDVRAHKKKLRKMYERHGFELVRMDTIFTEYETALYRYLIKDEKSTSSR